MKTYGSVYALMMLAVFSASLMLSSAASPPVNVPVADVTAHNGYVNIDGRLEDMITGTGMNGTNYPATWASWPPEATPDSWTNTGSSYDDEWQSRGLLTTGSNSKIGWVIFDLGSPQATLAEIYIWNARQATAGNIDIRSFNLYYSITPAVTPPPAPTGNGVTQDYNFAGGGWTLLNTGGAIDIPASSGGTPEAVVSLESVTARYVGIEILTNNGSTSNVGISEVGITKYPPPSGTVLIIK